MTILIAKNLRDKIGTLGHEPMRDRLLHHLELEGKGGKWYSLTKSPQFPSIRSCPNRVCSKWALDTCRR